MKNKIALAAAFLAATSYSTAEIVINDFLSFEGFVDMSYTHTDQEIGNNDESGNSFGIDQVEISWLFDFDPVTAQIDLTHTGTDNSNRASIVNGGDGTGVEQAFATYHLDNGGGITAGRFASMLGFEAFEPTGLYQYSFAYNAGEDIGSPLAISGGMLPGYDQGVKYTYEEGNTFFGVSLVDAVDVGRFGGDSGDFGIEVAGAINFDNGFSWFGGARYNDGDDDPLLNAALASYEDQYLLNSYVTFETGAWVFAGELVYSETDTGAADDFEVIQALLMANFAYSDAASVTGRLSYVEGEVGSTDQDFVKYTLAHGYAFTDNLFLVNELSFVDGETVADVDVEEIHAAVELIFSF